MHARRLVTHKFGPITSLLLMGLTVVFVGEATAQTRPKGSVRGIAVPTVIKPGSAVKQYPKCTRNHPGKTRRAESLAKQGDSRMGLSAARHAIRYAIERYQIQDLVSDTSLARADKDMYEFLKWKSGSASLLAAQWLTAGYQHYDSHADEAAATLLGYDLPGPQHQLRLPEQLTAWIKEQTDSAATATNTEICAGLFPQTEGTGGGTVPGAGGSTAPSEEGSGSTIAGIACVAVVELMRQATNRVYDRLGISGDWLLGKTKFDFKDDEIPVLAELRRNPPETPASTASTSSQTGRGTTRLPTSIQVPKRMTPKR